MKRGQFNQLPFEHRFWDRANPKMNFVECWSWGGYIGSRGYGVSPSQISVIRSGKSWPHVQSNVRAMAKVA